MTEMEKYGEKNPSTDYETEILKLFRQLTTIQKKVILLSAFLSSLVPDPEGLAAGLDGKGTEV